MTNIYSNLTVIVPVFNEGKNVLTLLKILSEQTICGFEVIFIDDGSSDNTIDIIEEYVHEGQKNKFTLRLIKQSNMGAAKARENAIRFAATKYVALVDCDDFLSSDSLENAMSNILLDKVNISLFKLHYAKEVNDISSSTFEYFTNRKIIDGYDAFSNCISNWGIHAFGIYERQLFVNAYDIYNRLNKGSINYLNNDEVVSRICFSSSKRIGLSEGDYFFINNAESTTRRINVNYYKVIYNAFFLLVYIQEQYAKDRHAVLINEAYKLIVSTIWSVTVRYKKWYKKLSDSERKLWRDLIKKSAIDVSRNIKYDRKSLPIKSKVQLFIIRHFI